MGKFRQVLTRVICPRQDNDIVIRFQVFIYIILIFFLCPRLPKAGVGHIAFRCDVTYVRAYVTFVTRFKFTCKFRCNFTSAFLWQLITFIPFGLES